MDLMDLFPPTASNTKTLRHQDQYREMAQPPFLNKKQSSRKMAIPPSIKVSNNPLSIILNI